MNTPDHSTSPCSTAFQDITPLQEHTILQKSINTHWRTNESESVTQLLEFTQIPNALNQKIYDLAYSLSEHLREKSKASGKAGIVQGLLQEFSLSSQEGIALMCLAEALLRIPDAATRDRLIKDKINQGNWKEHVGQSSLIFVNAAAWGLMLTGKLMATPTRKSMSSTLTGILARSGQGIIRKAVDVAMRMMGEQFVTGETIQEALEKSKPMQNAGFLYSYDMLGEAALTEHDAKRYMQDYEQAIHAIGQSAQKKGVYASAGISIKLSALHPRYQRAQVDRVHRELYPRIVELALLAKQYDIGLNIDAEESERLELSLELLERLCFEPELAGWNGIGFVIQAYQKRCFFLIDYIVDLAKRSEKRLMIRLVKGAYWDSEIKKAQVDGMEDYPVFTRKVHTDLSYLACAKKLLAEPEAIYPQFATHNAQTLATIYHLANPEQYYPTQYEFQCLHGMGEPLYKQVVTSLGIPCRIYAPVGNHETLLAYLVRRLLENGANTSFVNRISDKSVKIDELIQSPIQDIQTAASKEHVVGAKHPSISLPKDLYSLGRINSSGFDLNDDSCLAELNKIAQNLHQQQWQATPLIADQDATQYTTPAQPVLNPAQHQDIVGHVIEANTQDVHLALEKAQTIQPTWAATSPAERANYLESAADAMQSQLLELMVLLCRESGKTYANAIAEVREAIDFLRYYAKQAHTFDEKIKPLGNVLCISPWNFPLAIFTGQIAAALVAGNCVLAKPAEQTPLVAYQAVKMLHHAGIPTAALQFLPGDGASVGAALSADERIHGIMFTGSTEVAKILQKTTSKRLTPEGNPVTLIAETGGQNAMIVDSSALTEQVVLDVVSSAFDSAGQRCSALRILCLQKDCANSIQTMLKGAMQQLRLGNPRFLHTDIGPVIDAEAQETIQRHIEKMKSKGYPVHQYTFDDVDTQNASKEGTFIPPTVIELPNLDDLEREVFGPVLHIITYQQNELPQLIQRINDKGYGLTMGVHTRIDDTIQQVINHSNVGNLYVNRNIVGAVVGVQPFGGEGLSGTGPKAGGPLYLHRLAQAHTFNATTPFAVKQELHHQSKPDFEALHAFKAWAKMTFPALQVVDIQPFMVGTTYELQGPTGESNQYTMQPRQYIASIANNEQDYITQLLAIFAVNAQAVIAKDASFIQTHFAHLPHSVKSKIKLVSDINTAAFDAVLHHGETDELSALQQHIATQDGAIVSIHHQPTHSLHVAIERLVIEHAVSINTTAAGGNASLMTMA
ncbi:trifunctional transcriptional regulator/proline dehydrogenase/L-glutamate gamma-semialdehyde dehydrogenase [Acinetobacter sp. B5B]|uniref:trifunctional transcriptional regulator/proline dehydrogenase/L-glutamate gamma-semialdehyde dehydrogenase n=1 Tax=Acinetobacter baretiae TaxID=2605383 RepID=UPI0018C2FD82|nr:trifunctional transcriptional regulator/proline dehydrogenase/L-glutamate gamma-semialdehyde dehydrogenase [Acinetobacter baretiae]MBF7682714.1 trifunctional transcriptional regulator/proline dehydrogenase/L-glutamate gamma-semialdehyde dehydrogenase [Acinetobacter baretiae]